MTKQRKLILKLIRETDGHMTAEEIFLKAKQEMPVMAIATVYRNLNLMAEAGEIRRVAAAGGPDRFDRTVSDHEHLTCVRCGKMSDITIQNLKENLERWTGGPILSYELNMNYLCPECARKEKRERDIAQ